VNLAEPSDVPMLLLCVAGALLVLGTEPFAEPPKPPKKAKKKK